MEAAKKASESAKRLMACADEAGTNGTCLVLPMAFAESTCIGASKQHGCFFVCLLF